MSHNTGRESLGAQLAALAQMPGSGLTSEPAAYKDEYYVRMAEGAQVVGPQVLYFTLSSASQGGAEEPDPLIFQDTQQAMQSSVSLERTPLQHRMRPDGLRVLSERLHVRNYR